ncbi:unnamed protein product [Rhizoctonia solani]|uniref:DUF4211 domain-containing protein n=1 Tax=Rhizoctonia solani TaxID=456999 RepID=A0A8H3CNS3_9AGAM|nr:unnamed protein product [Rhizoctonia solani]
MPPKPCLPRTSSSPPIVVVDSDSDKQTPDVKRTVGPKGKWQTTLVDFAKLSKKTGPGPVQVESPTRTRSSPIRRRTRLSPVKSSRPSPRKANSSPIKVKPDSDEEDELAPTDTDADVGAVQFENKKRGLGRKSSRIITSDEEDEQFKVGKSGSSSGGDVKSASEEEEEEEEAAPRRVVKRKAVVVSLSDSEEEDEAPRRRIARRQSIQENPSDHGEDSEDDDPMDGLDDQVILNSRLRSAPERNNKRLEMRENLARLKRRKLGQDTPPVESSSEDEEDEQDENVVKPRGRRVYKPIPGARPSQPTLQEWIDGSVDDAPQVVVSRSPSPAKDENEDEAESSENDSWIEDDDGAPVAVLPEGYSMLGHQSLAHHFKVVMQLFVHLACLKAKKRLEFRQDERNGKVPHYSVPGVVFTVPLDVCSDQYFGLSLRALRRKMDGLRDSLVTSSIWTSGFKKALNTHPELHIHYLKFGVPGCGACRISTRMSTFKGALSGDDYDRDTFEPINRRSESVDSDEDSDNGGSKTTFDLGRYCQARVKTYHDFVHWEWQLFELVSDEIEILRTAHRRNDPGPARGQRPAANDPDGIMNWLDGRGIVQQEWSRLEQLMDGARGLEFKKNDDDVE